MFGTPWRVLRVHEIREVARARTKAGLREAADTVPDGHSERRHNTRRCLRLDGALVSVV